MKVVPTTFVLVALAVWGCTQAQSQGRVTLDTKLPVTFGQVIPIDNPKLWSIASPNLNMLRSELRSGGAVVDEITTSFGYRTIRFDAIGVTVDWRDRLIRLDHLEAAW